LLADTLYTGFKIPKDSSKSLIWIRTDNEIAKRKGTKRQIMVNTALHRKPNIEQHEPHKKGLNSRAHE